MAVKINLSCSASQRYFIQECSDRINNAFVARCSLTIPRRRAGEGGGRRPYVDDADLAHPINLAFSGVRHRLVFFR